MRQTRERHNSRELCLFSNCLHYSYYILSYLIVSLYKYWLFVEYDGSEYTPEAYFPDGDKSFRKISTKYGSTYFGTKENLAVCVTHQEARQESFEVYDNILKGTYTIRLKGPATFSSVPVYDYETDLEKLYAVNNVSVFKQGLIDVSATRHGLPMMYSAPHFLNADDEIIKHLGMDPQVIKHNSHVRFSLTNLCVCHAFSFFN